jgi:hypothetical protein
MTARAGGCLVPSPGKKPEGGKEEREETCFEEHAVGLVAGEVLRGADEGEEATETDE